MELLLLLPAALLVLPGVPWIIAVAMTFWARRRWRTLGSWRRLAVAIAVALWWTYILYDLSEVVWSDPGIVPIRFDLILIAPILLVTTLIALVAGGRKRKSVES